MLIISMSASVDGYIADRDGDFNWGAPSDELFRFHLDGVRELNGYLLGRRLYEDMRVWETDASLAARSDDHAAFAATWAALPKVVFSRTLERVEGNARLATGSVADELATLTGDVQIGGATLAADAIRLGLVDEFRLFRHPVVVGDGKPYFPRDVRLELTLAETRAFPSGVTLERYTR